MPVHKLFHIVHSIMLQSEWPSAATCPYTHNTFTLVLFNQIQVHRSTFRSCFVLMKGWPNLAKCNRSEVSLPYTKSELAWLNAGNYSVLQPIKCVWCLQYESAFGSQNGNMYPVQEHVNHQLRFCVHGCSAQCNTSGQLNNVLCTSESGLKSATVNRLS